MKSIAPPAPTVEAVDAAALDDDEPQADAQAEERHLRMPAALHGERLDRALAALVPEFSRNYLSQLVTDGTVTLAGQEIGRAHV